LAVSFIPALVVLRRRQWLVVLKTLWPMLLMTAIFDNLIIWSGIVAYDPQNISGIKIGLAPIEDFAYTVAAVLLVTTVWMSKSRGTK
jgi:lycopene cyclase domain-containing protein